MRTEASAPRSGSRDFGAPGSSTRSESFTRKAYTCRPGIMGTLTDHSSPSGERVIGLAEASHRLKSPMSATRRALAALNTNCSTIGSEARSAENAAGAIGVVAQYRRGSDAEWSSGAEDVRTLLTWLRDNVEPYGGDPHNIVLMGHSTGAAHVATYLFHEPSQLPSGPGITAAILSSGPSEEGADRTHTPLALVDSYAGPAVPILLWSAEYDAPAIETSVADLYAKLCRKYADCPMFVQWQGHNHGSTVLSIDTADTAVTDGIMRFYHGVIDHR